MFSGQGYAGGVSMGQQVGVQIIGIVATLAYTAVITFILLKALNALMGLRVDDETETMGLDISQHDERGYDL